MPLVASAAGARIQRTIGTAVVDSAVGEFVLVGHWTGQDVFQEGYVDVGVVHCKGHGGEQRQHFLAFRAISGQAAAFSVWASLRCLLPDALDDEAVARFYFLDDVADGTDIGIISQPLQIEKPPAENGHAVLAIDALQVCNDAELLGRHLRSLLLGGQLFREVDDFGGEFHVWMKLRRRVPVRSTAIGHRPLPEIAQAGVVHRFGPELRRQVWNGAEDGARPRRRFVVLGVPFHCWPSQVCGAAKPRQAALFSVTVSEAENGFEMRTAHADTDGWCNDWRSLFWNRFSYPKPWSPISVFGRGTAASFSRGVTQARPPRGEPP